MKKHPQHCLTKCFEPKKINTFIGKTISASKTYSFQCKKRSWMTKNLEHRGKSVGCPPRLGSSFCGILRLSLKQILLLKRSTNSNEKTPTALSYKMLEAKKNNILIGKNNFTIENQCFSFKKRSWMTKKT